MTPDGPSPRELAAFLEDGPCGYLRLRPDGTIASVNRTLLRSTGYTADELVGRRTLLELLAPGARIYHATHWAPTLELRGRVREAPAELLCADGSRLPVLLHGDLERDAAGHPACVYVSVFDATDRRRYERELLAARDLERDARARVERLQRITAATSAALTPEEVAGAVLDELADALDGAWGRVEVDGATGPVTLAVRRAAAPTLPVIGAVPGIAVPLRITDADAGSLQLAFAVGRALSAAERELVHAGAAVCAQALGRAQLFAEVDARSEQQAAVAALGSLALRTRDLPALAGEASRLVSATLDLDHVRLTRADADDPPDPDAPVSIDIGTGATRFGVMELHPRTGTTLSKADQAFCAAIAHVLWNAVARKRADDQTRHQATHDALTGLPNRVLLMEHLAQESARAARSGASFLLLLVDIDDFKLLNDTYGHEIGDHLLREVARRLDAGVRGIDLVARLGDDEFAVVCGAVRPGDGGIVADRIVDALSVPVRLASREYVPRVSLGIVAGDGASSPDALVRDAGVAMYRAKELGPSQHVHFNASMHDRGRRQLRIEADLRDALAQEQLRVFLQPLVCARTGRLESMEALVRWEHPDHGLVPPDAFIGVAERSGLIAAVGAHVLETACRQLVRWRTEGVVGHDVSVAVNVSGVQLVAPGFPDEVASVLQRTGLSATPHLLELEITESVLMRLEDSPGAILDALSTVGVGLHLDDFGTGASSLARLKRFPVDTLKIDRAFVSGIGHGAAEDEVIVEAIIAMAKALGLQVVAEGVETPDQLERLRDLGCDRIQGYLISRPLPADALRARLAELPLATSSASRR